MLSREPKSKDGKLPVITNVLISHAHEDHVGNLQHIIDTNMSKDLLVRIHHDDVALVDGRQKFSETREIIGVDRKGCIPCVPTMWLGIGRHILKDNLVVFPKNVLEQIEDQGREDDEKPMSSWCTNDIRAVRCPGHTQGHLLFYHVPTKIIIAGDLWMNLKGGLLGKIKFWSCCVSPSLTGPNPLSSYNMRMCYESMRKVLNTFPDFTHVYPSHDDGCGIPRSKIEKFVKSAGF